MVAIGEIYGSCAGDTPTAMYCRRRAVALARLMTAAPEMYAFLKRQLKNLNPEGCTAQIIRSILAKVEENNEKH